MMTTKHSEVGYGFSNEYLFFGNLWLSENKMSDVAKEVLKTIYRELPEEAHRIDVIEHILEMCKEELHASKIRLS